MPSSCGYIINRQLKKVFGVGQITALYFLRLFVHLIYGVIGDILHRNFDAHLFSLGDRLWFVSFQHDRRGSNNLHMSYVTSDELNHI